MDLDSALENKPAEGASATDILRADHREIERLFVEYDRDAGEIHARRITRQTLCMQVELHDELESSVLYPAVRESEPALVSAAERDHQALRSLTNQLRDHDENGESERLTAQLRTLVEHHIRDEEDRLFTHLEEWDDNRLLDLGGALIKRKEELTRSTEEFENPAT
jgi:hypothetical protein